jgi:arginine-tRNA-protein transferase
VKSEVPVLIQKTVMTVFNLYMPERLQPAELDEYLAKGWYRSRQLLFTADGFESHGQIHFLIWIRYRLQDWTFHPQNVAKRNNHFSVSIVPAYLSKEIEQLYAEYRKSVTFETAKTANAYLLGESKQNIFHTHLVEIRDGPDLIAAGYFDLGGESAAGILNFYHPAYKKYSLGKYLMKMQTDYARCSGKQWFYPGYISRTLLKFDYKIIDKKATEYFHWEQLAWLPYTPDLWNQFPITVPA